MQGKKERGIIIVGSGYKIYELMDKLLIETLNGIEEYDPKKFPELENYSKEMIMEPLPKFSEPFIEANPRGVIPPKYYKRKKK